MSLKVSKYALTESVVEAVQWVGGEIAHTFINKWTDGRTRMSGTDLIIQSTGQTERVELGDYIVKTGEGSFHQYTYDELADIYTKVE